MDARDREAVDVVRRDGGLLWFSRGKDSLACWCRLLDEGIEPLAVAYMYLVPPGSSGELLSFEEESLRWYETRFGVRIRRVPHPSLYRFLELDVLRGPTHVGAAKAAGFVEFSMAELDRAVIEDFCPGAAPWSVIGARAADSPNRRAHFARRGTFGESKDGRRVAHVCAWMLMDELVDLLHRHGVRLPADYQLFGRSFDGLDARFTAVLKRERPQDYARILEWFPRVDAEVFRHERL